MVRRLTLTIPKTILSLLGLLIKFGITDVWSAPLTTIRNNGDPANRVDIAILGDGYTSAELTKYAADVETFVQNLFDQEPYKEYQHYFNVHRVDVTSNDSGADHPERNPPIFSDTALDATYNCAGIQRLICVNTSKVNSVLSSSVPAEKRDVVLVIVNDPEYGGSGGFPAVASIHEAAVEIILHELGHSFGLLGDEYGGPPPPSCDSSIEPPDANVTKETVRERIKWNRWITPATPIPTSGSQSGVPGLYEGAKYCDIGLFRPTFNSKMRSLSQPFEQINSEQLVKRIYNWASPIDDSEPKTDHIDLTQGQSQTFRVSTPQPLSRPLEITWTLNNQFFSSANEITLQSANLPNGTHTLIVTVVDSTPVVRQDSNPPMLAENRSWIVTNVATTRTLTVASSKPDSGVPITVSPNDSNGLGNGSTQFTRTYNNNAAVTVTAPSTAGGNNFSSWSGCTSTSGSPATTCNVTMSADKTVTATYVTPTRTLTVASSNPASGVSITVTPNDNNSQGNGSTQFTRTYNNSTAVTVTAPLTAGGNNFSTWSGCDSASGMTCNVTMNASKTVTAVFVPAVPDTQINTGPAADTGGVTNSTTAIFNFTSTVAGSTFACSLDSAAFSACTSPKTYTKLKAGGHNFKVQAIAGGVADPSPASFDWTIDKTAPNTAITSAPAALTNTPIATFTFTSTETGGGFQCSLDGSPFAPCTSPFVSSALGDGKHNFQVKAVDAAGNLDKSAAKAKAWMVDTILPVTTITGKPTNPTTSTSATFKFTSEKKSTFQCRLDGGAFEACKSGKKNSGLLPGPHNFQVQATDAALNVELTPVSYDWTIQ